MKSKKLKVKSNMEKEKVIENKSYDFAKRIIKVYRYLTDKKEFVLSKQLLKSGTSIGTNVVEGQYSISKKDFKNKMSIVLKEAVESRYWINLLKDSDYISEMQANSLLQDLKDIIKILTKIVKNAS
ncbi:four helix bundle protein [Caminibacter pacificus]|uniref:Four helix bundle protein n=2 Tax=Caminibacter pacificus TaxID=1424653 RepID=A0AAJ4UXC1_9BACT|nr:four helix bundle protein [Caminibacter pacificus]